MTNTSLHLIGVLGKKRAGKDTFAATLLDEYGYQRVAFADPLRDAALRLDPLVGPAPLPDDLVPRYRSLSEVVGALGWERAKDSVPEVRGILQRLGTDAIRALDPDFWIRQALLPIEARTAPVVVTDVRFPNEADELVARGGTLVRIVRPGHPADGDEHPTEKALDNYPTRFTVTNGGTLEDLQEAARVFAALRH